MPLAPTLAREFAAVEQQTRVYPYPALLIDEAGRKFQEDGLIMVDSTFLEIFSFGMIQGDPATALDDPFSLVVTTTMANRLFGRADPVGKVVQMRALGNIFNEAMRHRAWPHCLSGCSPSDINQLEPPGQIRPLA